MEEQLTKNDTVLIHYARPNLSVPHDFSELIQTSLFIIKVSNLHRMIIHISTAMLTIESSIVTNFGGCHAISFKHVYFTRFIATQIHVSYQDKWPN